jgi:S1-C subfamily serine protease
VGSGVIVDAEGFIVTNEHVIRNSSQLTVVMPDGEELPADLVSADDPFTDLAVIKVDASDLPVLRWGDSDALRLGEKVVAIGTALNEFEGSVTVGVVSGLHRRWAREGVVMEDLVQTDAAINHGNSGGALINSRGELVGINSTIIRSTDSGEVVEGIGFAISSKVAAPIVSAIISQGSYTRAYLGIAHQDIVPSFAPFGLVADRGALVIRVSPDTPAEEAGLREGDIILRMGDIELTPDTPFINALGRLAPDVAVEFLVNRDGEEMTLDVKLVPRER